jgi:hypothetical protein
MKSGLCPLKEAPVNNKAFFQVVAIVSFLVMIVFLFRDGVSRLDFRVMLTGGLFVAASALSLLVGRCGTGGGNG